ncbi:hypothetical protein TASIC1_0013010100 [Trichoderma asperellum]|uniref:Phosphoribosylaminoimidazole-succinocarboxamide synthase n=1 Tax=Trichoderma asperellum TaxID=101201 RepID=A0A6V8R5J7_TRIAP|nr:hypothetical protein TASIC1_0013010100 [Trichoderma asperellum]
MSYQSIARDDEEPSRWRPSNNSRYQPVPDSEASPSTRHKRQQSSRTKRASASNRRPSRRPDSQASDVSDANQSTHPAGYHAIEPEEDPTVRFDEAQLAMFAADNASRMPNIKDELALAAGKVTPGVDDTPYIQYALQALVGGQSTSVPSHLVSNSSDGYSERYEPMRGFDESAGYSSPTRRDRITISASLRVLPFTAMASEDPRFTGPWQFKIFDAATWLAIFTIPLQSSAFTCIFVNDEWVWAPVQVVVWVLVGIYGVLCLATVILMAYWIVQWTGLAWDIRSIGDLLPLLNRSNIMHSYRRNDLAENAKVFKSQLRERWFDRLGYWRAEDATIGGIWYAIGASPDESFEFISGTMSKKGSNDFSIDPKAAQSSALGAPRGKYLPIHLRNGPIIASASVSFVLLVALLIVSFLPQTRLEDGFLPRLSAMPNDDAFSPANFVFSFVPALIGMILYLYFQGIDQSLRILQPWADLYDVNGSLAQRSLLADYAVCLPFQSTWRALRNGHWRVAAVSLLATLFIFISILGGGLFMALTRPDQTVRMYPNMPVFGVLLAFLFLYVGGLTLMVPHRRQFLLPRPVSSIAGIISLCSAEELTQDAAFRSVRGRKDLASRLGVGRDDAREESTWFFGIVPGKDEHRLSVRRMNNFSEKLPRSSRSMA